jgi:hypothetical protein
LARAKSFFVVKSPRAIPLLKHHNPLFLFLKINFLLFKNIEIALEIPYQVRSVRVKGTRNSIEFPLQSEAKSFLYRVLLAYFFVANESI